MLRVFRFPKKSTVKKDSEAPSSSTTFPIEQEPALEKQVSNLLFQFELAEMEKSRLQAEHPDLFEKLQRIEEAQSEARDSIRRILHTKNGPPDQVRPGSKIHIWAKSDFFFVEVTYKKKGCYYDPSLLPKAVFQIPGVVVEVDKAKLDVLAKTDGRIFRALKHGEWMTPSVRIDRMTRDD